MSETKGEKREKERKEATIVDRRGLLKRGMHPLRETKKTGHFYSVLTGGGVEGAGTMTYRQLIGGALVHVGKAGGSTLSSARRARELLLNGGTVQCNVDLEERTWEKPISFQSSSSCGQ